MMTYTFSKREKVLLAALAVVLIVIAWYMLVYQNAANEIARLDSEIASAQTTIATDSLRVTQIDEMRQEIEQRKADGVKPIEIPAYDNLQPLMQELNGIMAMTDTYSLSFDQVDTESGEYALRGVLIVYGCSSYDAAENVVNTLANGTYPCTVDSVSIVDSGSSRTSRSATSAVSASVHVVFFEKL